MLREENEGFSKLIVELSQKNIDENSVHQVSENIQSLIGYFSLDPSRVLDILLTAFEFNLQNRCYLTLLNEFGTQHSITQILGFKIQNSPESESLLKLVALLLREKLVVLEDIWPHISHKQESDPVADLIELQTKALDYQYKMLSINIMQASAYEPEFQKKKAEQD